MTDTDPLGASLADRAEEEVKRVENELSTEYNIKVTLK